MRSPAQCGGYGWTGETCCPDGDACVVQDAYYSQCEPDAVPALLRPAAAALRRAFARLYAALA